MCVIRRSVIYVYIVRTYVRMCTCNACVIVCMQIAMSFMSGSLFVRMWILFCAKIFQACKFMCGAFYMCEVSAPGDAASLK